MNDREREVIGEVLRLYRDLPCLWDVNSESYKDTAKKNVAWGILVRKLKEIEPDANVATVRKKIESLKTNYKRETKKVKESKERAGFVESEVHIPRLWYFKLMTFLDKRDEPQLSGIDPLITDESQQSAYGRPECNIRRQRKRQNEYVSEIKKPRTIETAQDPLEHNPKSPSSFAVYVGEQLEQMSTYQRSIAEKLMSEVIFLAKTENLNFDSRVETPSRSHAFSASPSHSSSRFPSPQFIKLSPSPYQFIHSPSSSSSTQVIQSYHSPEIIKQNASIQTQLAPRYDSYHSPETLQPPSSPQFQITQIQSSPQIQSDNQLTHSCEYQSEGVTQNSPKGTLLNCPVITIMPLSTKTMF